MYWDVLHVLAFIAQTLLAALICFMLLSSYVENQLRMFFKQKVAHVVQQAFVQSLAGVQEPEPSETPKAVDGLSPAALEDAEA